VGAGRTGRGLIVVRVKRRPLGCWAWLGVTTGVTVLSGVLLQVLFAYTVGRWAVGAAAAIVAATVALDATSPLLILARDTPRLTWLTWLTWLTLIVVQFVWPFAAPIMCSAVSARRKKTLSTS
jgi:hypothetical protein